MDTKSEGIKLDLLRREGGPTGGPNRKARRSEAAIYERFTRLVRRCQRFAKVSDATLTQLLKDGSAVGLVHDTFHAGRITGSERSFMLAKLGVVPK